MNLHQKQPCMLWKEPYIYCKELYIYSFAVSAQPLAPQSPTHCQYRALFREKRRRGGRKQQYAFILITLAHPLCPCRKKYYQYFFCTKRGHILKCIHALHCHVFVLGLPLSYRSLLTYDISICINALHPLYDVASTGGAQNPAKMETRLAYVAVVTRTGVSLSGTCI